MKLTTIGVRELRDSATQVLRSVREEGAHYVVTVHGKPSAVLIPVPEGAESTADEAWYEAWEREWDALAREIGANWIADKSAVELVAEGRR